MASRLGVSLTHRDHAQGVRFVTGHSRKGSLPDNLDWASLADKNMTTIYYMAGRTAGEIVDGLVSAGMQLDMPAAIVSSLTRANERRWHGMLRDLEEAVDAIGLDEPILIGVGSVFGKVAATTLRDLSPVRSASAVS
jgi:uroporphyrin-III C-methyltransferase/precorrin-2 dehydrogenase/sirohydrochlorin ferrochelatase